MNLAMDLIREALLGGSGGGGGGGGGGDEGPLSDVMFYDYDGTVLHSYTKAEFLNLTEMPANPDHTADGLTAQGWNWSLAGAKDVVGKAGFIDIGQLYETDDGATRIYLTIPSSVSSVNRKIEFPIKPTGTVVVNWGDGESDTLTGSSTVTASHTYQAGDYMVSVKKTSGSGNYTISASSDGYGKAFVTAIECGASTQGFSSYAGFPNIKHIVFNNTASTATGSVFSGLGIKHLTLPKSIKLYGTMFSYSSISSVALAENHTVQSGSASGSHSNASQLRRIYFPDGYTGVSPSSCARCEKVYVGEGATSVSGFGTSLSLSVLLLPSTLTSFGGSTAFGDCRCLSEIHIKAVTPPTFSGISASRVGTFTIYVPTASVDAYKAASGWSTYADRIVGE